MSEFLFVEAENFAENSKDVVISDEQFHEERKFIMEKARSFDGTPFTFQR